MLISFSKRFLFVSNTKAASTTIEEKLLRRYSAITITKTAYGKHFTYAEIVKHFAFIFNKSGIPAEAYFRFGVVREPLDWVVSWYNYRCREELVGKSSDNSCLGMSFDKFAGEVMKPEDRAPFARLGSQTKLFSDVDGNLGVDYLIPFPRLNADLQDIGKALGLDIPLTKTKEAHNVSPRIISTTDVHPDLAAKLREYYAEDAALFSKADKGGFGDVAKIIRSKLG